MSHLTLGLQENGLQHTNSITAVGMVLKLNLHENPLYDVIHT